MDITNVCKEVKQLEIPGTYCGRVTWYNNFGKLAVSPQAKPQRPLWWSYAAPVYKSKEVYVYREPVMRAPVIPSHNRPGKEPKCLPKIEQDKYIMVHTLKCTIYNGEK